MSDSFHPIPPTPLALPKVIWKLIQPSLDRFKVSFHRAYAPSQVSGPSIVCWITSRTPGGKTGEVYKPRLRATTVSSDGDHIVEYYGRGFTCTYHFEVVARLIDECDRITEMLEDLLEAITPELQQLGVQEWYFLDASGPRILEVRGEQLYSNTLIYQAIMDRVHRRTLPMIRAVSTHVGIEEIVSDIEVTHSGTARDVILLPSGKPYPNILRVLFASDTPEIWRKYGGCDGLDIPLEARIYVPGVDFVPEFDPSLQKTVLIWTDVGRRPTSGAVYYVTCGVLSA